LKPRSKEPAIRDWQGRASNEATWLVRCWKKWPDANVGVATGEGLIVVDLDSPEAEAYAHEKGFDDTPSVRTGRAGRGQHLWFSGEGRNSRGTIHPAIDVRGLGGYVVAPPSIHPDTGARYEWLVDLVQPLAPMPEWAFETNSTEERTVRVEGRFVEGERNPELHKLVSAWRGTGMSDDEIRAFLPMANEKRCLPPLDDEEVRTIAQSVIRYPVGWKPDHDLLVVERMTQRPSSMAVYVAIRKSCGVKDHCILSFDRLEELTAKSHDTVVNSVEDLVAVGLIEKTKHKHKGIDKANEYRLLTLPGDPVPET
jgi:hypothetical protein